jgi:predicted DNA-binding mobile mystery protein A
MTTPIKLLALDQLDERLPHLREAAEEIRRQALRGGWVRTLRSALGISERSFAKRLGVVSGSVQKLERNEQKGSVTLESLRRAAEALDAELVYAIVPRKPLRAVISERARALALERLKPIAQSMALEDQSLSEKQFERQVDELASDLEKKPAELWR